MESLTSSWRPDRAKLSQQGLWVLLALAISGCSSVAPKQPVEPAGPGPSRSAVAPVLESAVVPLSRFDGLAVEMSSLSWDRTVEKRSPHLGELPPRPPSADWQLLVGIADAFPAASPATAARTGSPRPGRVAPPPGQPKIEPSGGELQRLESAYLGALLNLFGGARTRSPDNSGGLYQDLSFNQDSAGLQDTVFENPFEEALAEQMVEPLPSQEMAQENPAPPAERVEPVPPQLHAQGGAQMDSPVERVEEIPEGPFRFVVAGELETGDASVRRAVRHEDGHFVLENYTRYTLNSAFLTFREDERVLTSDLDQDGHVDLAVIRTGGEVVVFQGRGGVRFQPWASFSVPDPSAMTAFELTGDAVVDLVVALAEIPHLAVYQQAGGGFSYQRELVLPFQPGLLLPGTGESEEPLLYVFDGQLTQVVAVASGGQGLLHSAPTSLLDEFHQHDVSLPDDDGVLSLRLGEEVALARRTSGGISAVGSFNLGPSSPLVILGDYSSWGMPQLLLVP